LKIYLNLQNRSSTIASINPNITKRCLSQYTPPSLPLDLSDSNPQSKMSTEDYDGKYSSQFR